MGLLRSDFHNLDELLIHELSDIRDAEERIVEALPQMEEAASSSELKALFREHCEQSKKQCERIDQIFGMLNSKPKWETCEAMQGLVKEGKEVINADADPAVRDAALIAAAQKVEHYEISAYGTARTFAEQLNRRDVADLLQMTLDEEKETDRRLTVLAEARINAMAV